MAREDLHFRLRIPEELKAKVDKSASDNHRSMTAEIVARLENSFVSNEHGTLGPNELSGAARVLYEAIEGLRGDTSLIRHLAEELMRQFISMRERGQPHG
ncbi:Arc family DNA-binding protein [Phyllobacterium sp. LjRoot231]|uniref:Arc family DNA-binding protein n=1 Tax=Phyllobacterium sp. LjRoot231 TaxID=3342289 RepID=UPI003ECE20FD